jgi:GTPase
MEDLKSKKEENTIKKGDEVSSSNTLYISENITNLKDSNSEDIKAQETSQIKLTTDIKISHENTITSSETTNNNGGLLQPEIEGVREVRVATIGNVDSGKSTLVGVLTKCILDDGRGYARQLVFNFDHEKQNGRTSSVTQEIMGFKEHKQVEPHKTTDKKNTLWGKIVKDSDKIVSLIDLCGHENYLKTTIFGLTGLVPDYAMIVIGANMGVQRMTKEHLGIALALKVPIFIVISKIDIAPQEIFKQTLDYITKVLKSTGAQKMPVIIRENDDVSVYADSIVSDRVCPIFCVSSVTGEGIDKLRQFIGNLQTRTSLNPISIKSSNEKVEFLIDGSFNVKGVGLVLSGTLVSGCVTLGQTLLLGPDKKGDFRPVVVKSIHFKRTSVEEVTSGNSACFQIKTKDKEILKSVDIRKGMVILDKDSHPKAVMEFDADVVILHHATTIKPKYQAVIHTGVVRQTAQVLSMTSELLRTGDKGTVRFRFIRSPEYLHEGATILFREGRTRGLGQISKLIYS